MKKTIVNNLFALLITVSAFANGTPAKTAFLIQNENLTVSISELDLSLFNSATYDAEKENLSFDLNDQVTFVQIFDATDELMFQLPVMSNKLKIGSSLFDSGNYKLGFMLKGTQKIHFTDVNIQ